MRILLVPVMVRQIHSMQGLQVHAPEMKALQQKWKHDKQRQNEELMKFYKENKINPAASCLPIVLQIPIFISLFYVLRHFDERHAAASTAARVDWLHLVDITEPVMDGWGPLLLVIYVASQLSSSYFMSTTMQGAQRVLLMVLPGRLRPVHPQLPGRPDALLADDEPLDDRAGARDPPADAEARRAREAELADARRRRSPQPPESGNGARRPLEAAAPPARKPVAGPPRRVKRKRGGGRRQAMTTRSPSRRPARRSARRNGAPLRELQRRVPGLDRDAIRFQVVSEGERGLLGVGYTPARVIATVDVAELRPHRRASRERRVRARPHSSASCSSGRSPRAACPRRCGSTRADEELVATLVGADLGVLIGRHGQTIDALQYLANAIGHRTQGDDRLPRRRRRRRLSRATGRDARDRRRAGRPSRLPPRAAASSSSR